MKKPRTLPLVDRYELALQDVQLLRSLFYDVLEKEFAVGLLDAEAFNRLFAYLDKTSCGRDAQREKAILLHNEEMIASRHALFDSMMSQFRNS